jgi:predicted P-loop ATPase
MEELVNEKKENIDRYVRRRYFGKRYVVKEQADWTRLLVDPDFDLEKGTVQKCAKSFSFLLEYCSIQNTPIWFDTFCTKVMVGDEVRQKHHDTYIKGELETFFAAAGEKASLNKRDVEDAIDLVARRNPRNSFAELIKRCWETYQVDGRVPITDISSNYLCKFLNAEDTEISRVIQRKAGLSMVARVFNPGIYVEGSFGIVGGTKAGKTFVTKSLCMDETVYYFGSKCDLENPWSYGASGDGKVIFDCPEAGDLLALDNNFKKQFMDTTIDEYPEKNEKQSTKHPRTWMIWFSSNEYQIITDETSTRRFWCVELIDDPNFDLDHQMIKDTVPRLWAEWYQMYLDLPNISPVHWCSTTKEYEMLDKSNQRFKVVNSFAEWLKNYLGVREQVSALEIRSALKSPTTGFQDVKPISDKRIGETMRNVLKWAAVKDPTGCMCYRKITSRAPTAAEKLLFGAP